MELGGELGSAEPGSENVLQTSALPHSEDKERENLAEGTAVPQSSHMQRRRHAWKFEGLHFEFIPSTWEVKVLVDNEKTTSEFSSLTGGRLLKLKAGARDVAEVSVMNKPVVDSENVPKALYPKPADKALSAANTEKSPYLQKA